MKVGKYLEGDFFRGSYALSFLPPIQDREVSASCLSSRVNGLPMAPSSQLDFPLQLIGTED